MSEVEYDGLVQTVSDEVSAKDDNVVWMISPPLAVNDNEPEWPLLAFPEGWHASP